MTEKQNLLIESAPNKFSLNGRREWTGSFGISGLSKMWNSPQLSFLHEDKTTLQKDMLARRNSHTTDVDIIITAKESYQALSPSSETFQQNKPPETSIVSKIKILAARGLAGAPALVIAILLNLFFGVSFGQVFFPTSWIFPDSVPRAIGVQVSYCVNQWVLLLYSVLQFYLGILISSTSFFLTFLLTFFLSFFKLDIQMFLMSTIICQIVMTLTSSFPMAFGMMMVENVPFMHVICNICIDAQGMGKDTFATVFVAFAISTVSVGVLFYLLGHYKMGNIVYFFPKHIIVGCIGGIGVFLFTTGMEGSTNTSWKWEIEIMAKFFSISLLPLWLTSLGFELLLRYLSSRIKNPLLAPFFFVSIPFIFYILLFITRTPIARAHDMGWFFQGVIGKTDPFLIWDLINFHNINWTSILKSAPTIIALTIFSLMHVPINIPSLAISTGYPADMNKELKAHGISNILSGCFGGLQNYVCYCNSVTYYKCNGGGILSGILLALSSSIFYFIGPSAVAYVPRCMAGCLLMHIGCDLTKEALWDSIGSFDIYEYGSVVAITIVMTAYGMTAGLALGAFCAALTFTLQSSQFITPIRTVRTAHTLRSSKWRTKEMLNLLQEHSKSINVIQLQGHLFFGNATLISSKVENLLINSNQNRDIKFIILDFTLVLAIDTSAAETIAKLHEICARFNVRLCYSRTSPQGFPCRTKLTDKLKKINVRDSEEESKHNSNTPEKNDNDLHKERTNKIVDKKMSKRSLNFDEKKLSQSELNSNVLDMPLKNNSDIESDDKNNSSNDANNNNYNFDDNKNNNNNNNNNSNKIDDSVFVADSLDGGLSWCEDVLIKENLLSSNNEENYSNIFMKDGRPIPAYLHQLHVLCPYESSEVLDALLSKFKKEYIKGGTVLWRQGDESTRAVLLCKGRLLSILEEEKEQFVTEEIFVGHLVRYMSHTLLLHFYFTYILIIAFHIY